MGIIYKRLPDKGNYEAYQSKPLPILIIFFIFPVVGAIFFFFFADKLNDLLVLGITFIILVLAIILFINEFRTVIKMMNASFLSKKMKKEGGGVFNFKNPTITYIEK